MTEAAMTQDLITRLSCDFEFLSEVPGTHPVDGDRVRIDLMARARSHVVQSGFTSDWFGIECKWADRIDGTTSKTTRMVWQSITYAQSRFEVGGDLVRPAFVAVYTPGDLDRRIDEHIHKLLALGHYGNVGRLYFYRDGRWGVKFVNNYAHRSSDGYYVNTSQLPRRRVGSV